MHRWSVPAAAALATLVALAGCVDLSEDAKGPEGQQKATDDEGPRQGLEGGPPEEWNATLDEPPKWRLGQWWDVRVTDLLGNVHESTIVVAGAEPDAYLTGMPAGSFSHALMVLHVPAIGQVGKSDLSWDVHDAVFHPLRFPLQEGDTWDTMWSAQEVTADVVDVSGTRAEVEIIGNNQHFTLVYDAAVGTIVSIDMPGYATMEVTAHGFEYEGLVTVPHEHDLVFFHGRIAGVIGIGFQSQEPHPPVETITLSGDYDRVSFGLVAFALAPGFFSVDVTAPDGTSYSAELVATGQNEIMIEILDHDDPVGDWELVFVAGGAGAVYIEGIAYHVFDIELPSGCLVGAADEHAHHGGTAQDAC